MSKPVKVQPMRWRVEHRDSKGDVSNILETHNHVRMEQQLAWCIQNSWLLCAGDTIHIIRLTED